MAKPHIKLTVVIDGGLVQAVIAGGDVGEVEIDICTVDYDCTDEEGGVPVPQDGPGSHTELAFVNYPSIGIDDDDFFGQVEAAHESKCND
jgi:hypothetical protein